MSEPIDFAFLHGAAQGGWVWDEAIRALGLQTGGAFGRALALDVPGCGGKRSRAAEALGPDEIAAELVADIEAAGFDQVVLVGHSLAGTILPRMAAQRPALFRRLIYVAAAAPPPGRTFFEPPDLTVRVETPREHRAPPALDAATLRALMQPMLCNDMSPDQTEAFLAKLGRDAWPGPMASFTAWRYDHLNQIPASYVLCLRDGIAPVGVQEMMAERLQASGRVRIDAGHQVMTTRPHAFAEALLHDARA